MIVPAFAILAASNFVTVTVEVLSNTTVTIPSGATVADIYAIGSGEGGANFLSQGGILYGGEGGDGGDCVFVLGYSVVGHNNIQVFVLQGGDPFSLGAGQDAPGSDTSMSFGDVGTTFLLAPGGASQFFFNNPTIPLGGAWHQGGIGADGVSGSPHPGGGGGGAGNTDAPGQTVSGISAGAAGAGSLPAGAGGNAGSSGLNGSAASNYGGGGGGDGGGGGGSGRGGGKGGDGYVKIVFR